MRQLPSLSALRAFEAAARHGSLSLAAQELQVTPSAVSKQIKALEESVGQGLIKRAGKGIELTLEGRRLMAPLTKAFDALDLAVLSIDGKAFEGSVTVNCMPALAANWLIPRLSQFTENHPNVSVILLSGGHSVAAEGVDLSIVYGQPNWRDRRVQLLRQLDLFPVCSPKLANGPHEIRKLPDLLYHVLLDDPEGTHWQSFLASHGLDASAAKRTLRFQDFSHCLAAARIGLGVAMGDNITTAGDLATGALIRPLRETIRRQKVAYYLVTSPNRETAASVHAFSNWLMAEMQRSGETWSDSDASP